MRISNSPAFINERALPNEKKKKRTKEKEKE